MRNNSAGMTPADIEQAIAERLRARMQVPGLVKRVYRAKEYANTKEQSQLVPSIAVIYNGYTPGDETGNGTVQAVNFNFLVVLVSRSTTDTINSTGAKDDNAVLFDAAMSCLTGWSPGKGARRLILAPAPGAGHSDAGLVYTPLSFNTRTTYTADTSPDPAPPTP